MGNKAKYGVGSRGNSRPRESQPIRSRQSPSSQQTPRSHVADQKPRMLLANTSQPRWIFDLETLVFLEVNDAAIRVYGYTEQEFLDLKVSDLLTPEDTPLLAEYLEQLSSERTFSGVWRHRRKD